MDSDPYCDEISSSGMNSYEDLEVRSRWDWRFDDEFVLTLILMTFEGLLLVDIDMMK